MLRSVVVYFLVGVVLNYAVVMVIVMQWWGETACDTDWASALNDTRLGVVYPAESRGERWEINQGLRLIDVTFKETSSGVIQEYHSIEVDPLLPYDYIRKMRLPWMQSALPDSTHSEFGRMPLPDWIRRQIQLPPSGEVSIIIAGWPMRSNMCQITTIEDEDLVRMNEIDRQHFATIRGGIHIPNQEERTSRAQVDGSTYSSIRVSRGTGLRFSWPGRIYPRSIPLVPLWPGLIMNSMFYGAIAWALMHPRTIWRRLTRQKGHCWNCGYNIAADGQATCPECGHEAKVAAHV